MVYTLSLDNQNNLYLDENKTWQKKTKTNPNRGLVGTENGVATIQPNHKLCTHHRLKHHSQKFDVPCQCMADYPPVLWLLHNSSFAFWTMCYVSSGDSQVCMSDLRSDNAGLAQIPH